MKSNQVNQSFVNEMKSNRIESNQSINQPMNECMNESIHQSINPYQAVLGLIGKIKSSQFK